MITVDVRLEAEAIPDSNTWIDTGNFTRQTGESANYRAFYTFSSTDYGVFENVSMVITLDDFYNNIVDFVGVILPSGSTYQTSSTATQKILTVWFPPSLPAGQTGYIEFVVQSRVYRGPNGELIPSHTNINGEFVDGISGDREDFDLSEDGPVWVVEAENKYDCKKTVTINGNLWTPDSDAYIVEYKLTQTSGGSTIIGSWGVVDSYHVDTLPTIPGVTPEILYASPSNYTVNGNQITWTPGYPPLGGSLGIRYPKDQIDAIGGIEALGEITNHWDVYITLIGGVEIVVPAEVTHTILPIPPQVVGTVSASKTERSVVPYPANGLYYNSGVIQYSYVVRLSNSNVIPTAYKVIEENIFFTFEDGTTATLTGDDYHWASLSTNAVSGHFEYTTNLNPNFTIYPNITIPSGIYQPFPPSTSTEYVNKWMVYATGIRTPNNWAMLVGTYVYLNQRSFGSKRITSLTNEAVAAVDLPDGTTISQNISCVTPFTYDEQIQWAIDTFSVREPVLNLGEEVVLDVGTVFTNATSVEVQGSDLYIILPHDILYVSSTEAATVTENWNGTTNTLVHISRSAVIPPLENIEQESEIIIQVSPSATLGQHTIEAYYVINPTQSNDPNIVFMPFENIEPDIYDFNQNGNTSELVPYASLTLLADSSNVVNVLKMSKSANDANFQINNDTQVTRNELFNYKFFVRNDSDEEMLYVTIIDIFPFVGDQLNSAWAPMLEQLPEVPSYVTVFYSQSTTPAMEPIGTGGVNDWSTIPPQDLHSVKALKFDFGSMVFAPGESAEILLTMSAPTSAEEQTYSYNSVSYIASARDSNGHVTQYLPAYSPPAYARLTFRDFDTFVGDFVWYDLNGNGIQDVGEPGINGVNVQLLDTNGNILYEQETHNHPTTGEPGYYGFVGVWPQNYFAQFPVLVEDIYTLTIPHQVLRENNSVADPENGLSPEFTVNEGSYIYNIDAGYVSADPPVGKVGDYVWLDLNENGIQDPGEPGISGVPVELYYHDGTFISRTTTGSLAYRGANGYYEFAGVPYGEYYVTFPITLGNGDHLTIANAGSNPNINSKPNPATGVTHTFALDETNPEVLNIDAGYVLRDIVPGVIGDYIWLDINKNGIQDPDEPGINGVTVALYNAAGDLVATTVTTANPNNPTQNGYYEFTAEPGEYYVLFPTELANGNTLTLPNVGTDNDINSKPNQISGSTPVFILGEGQQILNMDAGYIEPDIEPGIIGDFVWLDLNKNGLQDPGEPGINGVTVVLYSADGSVVATTLTIDNPANGEPGYYEFTVPPGNYYLLFPTQLPNTDLLTTANVGTNPNINSKPNTDTGLTDVFTLAAGQEILNLDAGYIQQEVLPGVIGDYVWLDLNENGLQDPDEPGINGVTVQLYNRYNVLIDSMVTTNNPSTGAAGYYVFTVPAGEYYVAFPPALPNGETLTTTNVGTNYNINSKPNVENGFTSIIILEEGQSILYMDAGYIPAPVPPQEEFEITKCASKCCVVPCEKLYYQITVTNTGETSLENLQVVDTIDSTGISVKKVFAEIDGIPTINVTVTTENGSHTITVLDEIPPGSILTLKLYAVVSPCACPGIVLNSAVAFTEGYTAAAEEVSVTICRRCK